MASICSSELSPEEPLVTDNSDAVPSSASSTCSDSVDTLEVRRERPRRHASRISFAEMDSPPSEPVLKVIRRPGKRGRPPRRWVYSDSDDVFFDEPKDKLVKRLSRNENEKMRRDRLNTYVAELAHLLPMVVAANRKMEKSSILRLAVNYLRVYRDFVRNETSPEPVWNYLDANGINQLIEQCNGNFLMVSSKKGVITFASEGLTTALGHKLVDVLGQTVFEFIHPDDHDLYLEQFDPSDSNSRQFCLRVLNTLSNDEEQFLPVTFQGYIKMVQPLQSPFFKGKEEDSEYLIAIGKLPHCYQSIENFKPKVDCSLTSYLVYHDAFGEIQYLDPRSALLTGYMPHELIGQDPYTFVSKDDRPLVAHSHYKLLTEDVVVTIYRIFNKDGSLSYLKTNTHKVLHSWSKKIKYLISVNEIISEELGKRLLKEFIQKKQIDELEEEMKKKFIKEAEDPEVCLPDSTMPSSSQAESTLVLTDLSDPYDIPSIRTHLPKLMDLCRRSEGEVYGEDEDSLQPVSTSVNDEHAEEYDVQLSSDRSSVPNTSKTANSADTGETVKHVPHRLRSLIRHPSEGSEGIKSQQYKTCTKAYRSNKLSFLLSSKGKDGSGSTKEKESMEDTKVDPEPSSSSVSECESTSGEGHLLCSHKSSFCDHLANIKSPQLPLWTRQHDMRQESQSSLLYSMLKQMQDSEEKLDLHQDNEYWGTEDLPKDEKEGVQ